MSEGSASFSVVGAGRVGTSLALALVRTGFRCASIVARQTTTRAVLRRRLLRSDILKSISDLKDNFQFVIIAVRDGEIRSVADLLGANRNIEWRDKIVFHTSGVVELDALDKLKARGANIGAFHPLAPFASKFASQKARSIFYDFAGDKKSLRLARELAHRLESRLFVLKSERERTMLHVASVLASNFTVIAARTSEEMAAGIIGSGNSKSVIDRLLSDTVDNIFSKKGYEALTGPLARGDINVIQKHLRILENDPPLLQFYKSSALLGIESLLKTNLQNARDSRLIRIKKLLEDK